MPLSGINRRLPVAPLAGVERQGCRSLGSGGSSVGVSCSYPVSTSTIFGKHPFSVLRPQFHQGPSLGEGSSVLVAERSCRTRSFAFSGLLQPSFCGDESFGVVETSPRFVNPQSESLQGSLQDGNPPVCASVHAEQRLDGIYRLEGCLLASSNPSGQLQVPQICGLESGLSVQGSLFRPLQGPTSFHTGHGSGVGLSSFSGYANMLLSRRLVDSSSFSSLGSSGLRHGVKSMPKSRYYSQLGEIQSYSFPTSGISRSDYRFPSFQGFSLPSKSREAILNCRRTSVL